MVEPAVVIVSYRLPTARLREFVAMNGDKLQQCGAALYVVCDGETRQSALGNDRLANVRLLEYPAPLPRFSLAKVANYGIRYAAEHGHGPIVKSDVDVCFGEVLPWLLDISPALAKAPKYFDVPSATELGSVAYVLPDGQGTVAMTADNWRAVQGYDERCWGYGGEDNELCRRLAARGLTVDDSRHVYHIHHGDKWNRKCGFNPQRGETNISMRPRADDSQPNWGKANG